MISRCASSLLSTIPIRCDSLSAAQSLLGDLIRDDIIVATRADSAALWLDPEFGWHVVIATGNLRGMIADLETANII